MNYTAHFFLKNIFSENICVFAAERIPIEMIWQVEFAILFCERQRNVSTLFEKCIRDPKR